MTQMNFKSTGVVALSMTASFVAGLVYGTLYQINRTVTACAFAIAIGVKVIFEKISTLFLKPFMKAKEFAAIQLAAHSLFYIFAITAFRNLDIIGNKGTAFLTFGASLLLIVDVSRYTKA